MAATAKQSRFKEAALAAQEQAAATEEGKTQAMMFALLQEQHQLQLEAMAAANKASIGNGKRRSSLNYCETKIGTLPPHKFTNYVIGNQAYEDLP